jgi:putative transposase
LEVEFCVEALEEALSLYGASDIFNTDQGSQFTSHDWIKELHQHDIKISMDGKGRWMDNVFIERLWRSLKYECIYLHEFDCGSAVKKGLQAWLGFYNERRPHSTFDGQTPHEVYTQFAA